MVIFSSYKCGAAFVVFATFAIWLRLFPIAISCSTNGVRFGAATGAGDRLGRRRSPQTELPRVLAEARPCPLRALCKRLALARR